MIRRGACQQVVRHGAGGMARAHFLRQGHKAEERHCE